MFSLKKNSVCVFNTIVPCREFSVVAGAWGKPWTAGGSIQGTKEHWVPNRDVHRPGQQEGSANGLCLGSGSPKMYMKLISCAIHSWVCTAVLSIVWDSVERSAVMNYLRYITLKYNENKLLHFLSLVILVSVLAEYDFAQTLPFCGTVGKYEKVNLAVLQPWIHPILLAPGQQLLALSSRHDIPPFLLYWLLKIFLLQ